MKLIHIFLGVMFAVCSVANGAENHSLGSQFSKWLNHIPEGEEPSYGFPTREDLTDAVLGTPFEVLEINPGFYQKRQKNIVNSLRPTLRLIYPVYLNGNIVSLMHAAKDSKGSVVIYSVGSMMVANRINATFKRSLEFIDSSKIIIDIDKKREFFLGNESYKKKFSNQFVILVEKIKSNLNPLSENDFVDQVIDFEVGAPKSAACKSSFVSAKGSSIDESDAENSSMRNWSSAAKKKYGVNFSRWDASKSKDVVCKPRGPKITECVAKAKPCYKKPKPPPKKVLGVKYHKQEQSNWCWAGTTQSLINYYKVKTEKKQCKLVDIGLSRKDCCDKPSSKNCNKPNNSRKRRKILKKYGVDSKRKKDPISTNNLIKEVKARHPGIVTWKWTDRKVGHVVVFYGYEGSNIYLMDPNSGKRVMTYNKAVSSGKREWTYTLTTEKK